jgi:lipid-A-disaccharide synthase-like uncharacterized protein
VQWLSSEREKKSVVPVAFWYLSIAGGLALLIYAVHREDPVFMLGQALGLFVYVRNLQLIRRNALEATARLKIHDGDAEDVSRSTSVPARRKAA